MNKYGLLFAGCGDMNPEGYNIRYKNDLEYMYSVLVNKYSYNKNNVDVFLANGVSIIDRESSEVIKTRPGTYTNFKNALEKYINTNSDDQLIIMISNHGGMLKDNRTLILGFLPYEMKNMLLDEFEELINKIPCKKIIIMGQCYGGNFLKCKFKNTIILTANKPNKESYAKNYVEYDEFLYQFISFMNGEYPNGLSLNKLQFDCDDKNIEHAYLYSVASDRYCNGTFPTRTEHPQMLEHGILARNTYI